MPDTEKSLENFFARNMLKNIFWPNNFLLKCFVRESFTKNWFLLYTQRSPGGSSRRRGRDFREIIERGDPNNFIKFHLCLIFFHLKPFLCLPVEWLDYDDNFLMLLLKQFFLSFLDYTSPWVGIWMTHCRPILKYFGQSGNTCGITFFSSFGFFRVRLILLPFTMYVSVLRTSVGWKYFSHTAELLDGAQFFLGMAFSH